jgi:hypothetical protein
MVLLLIFLAWAAPCLAAAPTPSATPDPQQLRQEILNDPNLQQREVTPTPLVPDLPSLPHVNLPFLRWVFIGVGLGLAIILTILLGPPLLRYLTRLRQKRPSAALAGDAEVTTAEEAIQRAQQASAVQDYRQAMRLLYLATLLKLDEIGTLRYDRALTNREYVRQVSLSADLSSALRPVVETFDDVWYGYRPLTPAGYATFAAQVDGLMKAAEGHAKE